MWGSVNLSSGIARTAFQTAAPAGSGGLTAQKLARPGGEPASAAAQAAAQWARIRCRLQADVGEVEYRSWFRQMTLGGLEGEELTMYLPSRFLRDWVRSNYGEKITALWQLENPAIRQVDIRLDEAAEPALAESLTPPPEPASPRQAAAAAPARAPATVPGSCWWEPR